MIWSFNPQSTLAYSGIVCFVIADDFPIDCPATFTLVYFKATYIIG